MSGDGSMLAIGEPAHDGHAFGMSGEVYIFRRANNGSWSLSATLNAPEFLTADKPNVVTYRWDGSSWMREMTIQPPIAGTAWGLTMAFNRRGTLLAIGDFLSPAGGAGVSDAATQGTTIDGAVFMFERSSAPAQPWRLRSQVKAPNPDNSDLFATSLALDGSGRTLAIGAIREASAARGIDGDRSDNSARDAGAAYLY